MVLLEILEMRYMVKSSNYHFHSIQKKRGDIVARISSDVQELDNSFLSIFELIIKDPLMVLFTLFVFD